MIIALLILILFAVLFPGFLRLVFGLIFFGVVLIIATAHADETGTGIALPTVDVETECHKAFSQENELHYFNACIDQNQDAYNDLKFIWPDTPDSVKRSAIASTNSVPKISPWYYKELFGYVLDFRRMYDYQHARPHHFEQ